MTAPEQCVGPPSPLCACSQSTPTEAAGWHWVFCWAVTYRSGPRSLPQKARHRLYAHIGTRGSDRRPCREPAGSSQTWMGSVVSMLARTSRERKIYHEEHNQFRTCIKLLYDNCLKHHMYFERKTDFVNCICKGSTKIYSGSFQLLAKVW